MLSYGYMFILAIVKAVAMMQDAGQISRQPV